MGTPPPRGRDSVPPPRRHVAMADFVNKQFDKEEVHAKVLEQYDQEHTRVFYKYVMGGGGHDIHFGVFKDPSWGVKESGEATTNIMLDLLDWAETMTGDKHILDLGSGHGGGSHVMAQRFKCKVTGINIGPEQNKVNMDPARSWALRSRCLQWWATSTIHCRSMTTPSMRASAARCCATLATRSTR